jgi:hypothetical protein
MNKAQQMRWSRRGADLLLQVRCANPKPQGHGLPTRRKARPPVARMTTFLPISNSEEPSLTSSHTHTSTGVIGASEDMLEIDFVDGTIHQIGDQYGIGRQ